MVEHWHGDVKVEWTDGEWERLQKIKRGEFVPDVVPTTTTLQSSVPRWLKDRVCEYASEKSMTPSELIRNVLYILAS